MSIQRRVAVALTLVLLATACERPEVEARPSRVSPRWQPLILPVPAGPSGRLMLRDVATCAGHWYVVGAVADPAGGTRPAAWTSSDARNWRSIELTAKTYYGARNILYSAACRPDGQVAVLGAKRGGAHANPRVSSWLHRPDGSLVEVTAPFELYGGPKAVDVARISAGPAGWLIAGNRTSGAAVWVSPDSTRFELIEAAPELASDGRGESWAFDSVATARGWLLVGGLIRSGRIDRDPLAWTSADGRAWRRVEVPASDEYDELQRVVLIGDTPVAVGLRGHAFGAWRVEGAGGWVAVGRFGAPGPDNLPRVRGLTLVAGRLLAAVSDGSAHRLWLSADRGGSWHPVVGPATMPAGAEREIAVRAMGEQVLLAIDDGQRAGLWLIGAAELSAPGG